MKELIDKYFTENYEYLKKVAEFHINRCGRDFEPDILVSNAYVYLIESIGKYSNEDIPKWCTAFMCFEMERSKSKSNYHNNKTKNNDLSIDEAFNFLVDKEVEKEILFCIDMDTFITNLDRFDLILWEVYYEKGIQTKRDIAEHFNIDPSSALIYINRVKEKYKQYVKS